MKAAGSIALAAVLAALVAPEFSRYLADRRVGVATAAFRELVEKGGSDPETVRRIRAVGELALSETRHLPGDPRPWMVGASSYLVIGEPERALEFYREAFAMGERAEIDLNLGRAYTRLGRTDSAAAAYLRAGWVNPEILSSLPDGVKAPVLAEIARLTEELRAGRLTSPPPLPDEERR